MDFVNWLNYEGLMNFRNGQGPRVSEGRAPEGFC